MCNIETSSLLYTVLLSASFLLWCDDFNIFLVWLTALICVVSSSSKQLFSA